MELSTKTMAFLSKTCFILFAVCIGFLYGNTSFLYQTKDHGFENWEIQNFYINKPLRELIKDHNETTQMNIAGSYFTKENHTLIQTRLNSPIIMVSPAYQITYKAKFFINNEEVKFSVSDLRVYDGVSATNTTPSFRFKKWSHGTLLESGKEIIKSVEHNIHGFRYAFFRLQFRILWNEPSSVSQIKTMNLTYFELTYRNCPAVIHNLVQYNNTVAAREEYVPIKSIGKCVRNAEKEVSRKTRELYRFCDHKASARFIEECLCKPGFEPINNLSECKECRNGYFQQYQSKSHCKKCGERSQDVNNVRCRCRENTYRFAREHNDGTAPCHEYPTKPFKAQTATSSNSTVVLIWDAPKSLGSLSNITYTLHCTAPEAVCKASKLHDKIIKIRGGTQSARLDNLLSFTTYTFQLCAHNDVSLSNMFMETGKNCLEFEATTKEGYPTKVENFRVAEINTNKEIVSFSWTRPLSTGNKHLKYAIRCGSRNETKDSTGNMHEFTTIEVEPTTDQIGCQITPFATDRKNRRLYGPTEIIKFDFHSSRLVFPTKDISNIELIIGGSIGAVAFLILLILIGIQLGKVNRKQKDKLLVLANQLQHERLELENLARTTRNFRLNQKNMYVPLNVLLSQPLLDGQAPIYEEVPTGFEYDYKDLSIKQALGEGNFAIVYQADAKNICGYSGTSTVAVKELRQGSSLQDKDDFEGELELMMGMSHHPHVVRLLGICSRPRRCMIVEYLPGGDLLSYLLKSRKYRQTTTEGSFFTAEDLLTFAYQITQGMKHIAQYNIVHRDLACRNVLVGYNRVCKVADLGLARKLNNEGVYIRLKQEKLPVKWLPIETIKYRRSTLNSDIWSYGITLWEIVTIGGMPYPEYKSREIPELLDKGYRMSKPNACSDELYEMMLDCWQENEEARPTFSHLSQRLEEMIQDLKDYIHTDLYNDDSSYLHFDGDEDIDDEVFVEADDDDNDEDDIKHDENMTNDVEYDENMTNDVKYGENMTNDIEYDENMTDDVKYGKNMTENNNGVVNQLHNMV